MINGPGVERSEGWEVPWLGPPTDHSLSPSSSCVLLLQPRSRAQSRSPHRAFRTELIPEQSSTVEPSVGGLSLGGAQDG